MALKKILALVAGVALFASSAAAEDVTLHQESFDSMANLTASATPPVTPSLLGAAWGLSNVKGVRLPIFGNPKVLSGNSGTFFVGRLLGRSGSLKVKAVDISNYKDLKVNVSLAAGVDLPAVGALTKLRDGFSRLEYLSVMVNNKPLRMFVGGNPLRSSQYRPAMSALVNVATGEAIPTTFGNFSFEIPASMVEGATELNIEFKARTLSGYVGIDSLSVVGKAKEPPVREETVVKDHVSSRELWDGEWFVHHGCSVGHPCSIGEIGGTVFTGNGEVLKKVGGIFGHMDVNQYPNRGNIDQMDFYLFFFNTVQDYINDPFLRNPATNGRVREYGKPSNPDYKTIIGQSLLDPDLPEKFNYYYWELDIEDMGIVTVPGQKHAVALLPIGNSASGGAVMALARGTAPFVGTEVDYYYMTGSYATPLALDAIGGGDYQYFANKITTIPAAN